MAEENECSICLQDLEYDIIKLDCNHFFHGNCINDWRKKNNSCPICRKIIINIIKIEKSNKVSKNFFFISISISLFILFISLIFIVIPKLNINQKFIQLKKVLNFKYISQKFQFNNIFTRKQKKTKNRYFSTLNYVYNKKIRNKKSYIKSILYNIKSIIKILNKLINIIKKIIKIYENITNLLIKQFNLLIKVLIIIIKLIVKIINYFKRKILKSSIKQVNKICFHILKKLKKVILV